MRLLFDENLSYRLVDALDDVYPGSTHVRDVGLFGADDAAVWEYAATHDFLLTSKDTDFYQRSLVFGAPPRVVWRSTHVDPQFRGLMRSIVIQLP